MRKNLMKNQRGAALLETAITLPIILLIAVGIFEFGRAYQTWQVLTNAAREGARIAILAGPSDADVENAVKAYIDAGKLDKNKASVTIERNVPMGIKTASKVTVNFQFSFMWLNPVAKLVKKGSGAGSAPLTIQSVALMRNEG